MPFLRIFGKMPKKGYRQTEEHKRKRMKPKIKKICLFCGVEYKVYPSEINRKFCSQKCSNLSPIRRKKIGDGNRGEKCHFWVDGRRGAKDYDNLYARKLRENPKHRINRNTATAIWFAIKKNKTGRRWENLVGYSLQELRKHLEKLFNKKMSWNNYCSYWELDHIKPKSLFHYETAEDPEFRECWSLSNLQPLEISENRRKYNHYAILKNIK